MSTQYPSEREEVGWMLKDIKDQQSSQSTGAPAPCVWLEDDVRAYHPDCWREASHDHHEIYKWEFCPYCGRKIECQQ